MDTERVGELLFRLLSTDATILDLTPIFSTRPDPDLFQNPSIEFPVVHGNRLPNKLGRRLPIADTHTKVKSPFCDP